jgi:trehalose-6-phosphate synthase
MSTIIPQSELIEILAVPAQNLASAENFNLLYYRQERFSRHFLLFQREKLYVEIKKYSHLISNYGTTLYVADTTS